MTGLAGGGVDLSSSPTGTESDDFCAAPKEFVEVGLGRNLGPDGIGILEHNIQ